MKNTETDRAIMERVLQALSDVVADIDAENVRRFEKSGDLAQIVNSPGIERARELLEERTGKYPLPNNPFLAEEYPRYWELSDSDDKECRNCKKYPPKCAGCKFRDGDYLTPTERKILDVGRIWHNRARCKKCGEIIESRHRHDFVMCKCGAVGIDGGTWYIRCTGMPDDMELLTELYDPEPSE